MQTLLNLIQAMDARVYSWLSQFHGGWFLDRLVSHIEANTLFKTGLLIAGYCYFWFRKRPGQQHRRNAIVTIFVGTIVGLAITRIAATIAPFRVRPMYATNLQQHALSLPPISNFVDWSSWPCDHAAYLGALAYGLGRLSRRLMVPAMTFFALWICVPRMYLGIHYASDILMGTAIGLASVWAALRIEEVQEFVVRPLMSFMEAKPQLFYGAAYIVLFEMTTLFADIQQPVHALLGTVSTSKGHHHIALEVGMVAFASVSVGGVIFRRIIRRHQAALNAGTMRNPGSAVSTWMKSFVSG
jgi:membrane-associated phospholipid phosphatase